MWDDEDDAPDAGFEEEDLWEDLSEAEIEQQEQKDLDRRAELEADERADIQRKEGLDAAQAEALLLEAEPIDMEAATRSLLHGEVEESFAEGFTSLGVPGRTPPPVAQFDVPLRVDRFDQALAEEMRELSPAWQEVEARRGEEVENFAQAMDLFFHALWKPYPERRDEETLTPKGKQLKQVLDLAESLAEWKQLRGDSIMDQVASALGATAIGSVLEIPGGKDGDEGGGDGEIPEEKLREMRSALKQALTQAQSDVEDQKQAEGVLWGGGPGEERKVPPQARLELGQKLRGNQRLKRLLELIGRFTHIAQRTHKSRLTHDRDELANIVLGNDLRDVLPQELLPLAEDELEMLFFYAYAEQNLLQYSFESKVPLGRGPIVARIDRSGSMSSYLEGAKKYGMKEDQVTCMEWAVATALALAVIARKEKRDLNVGFFDHYMGKTWTFPQGQVTPEALYEIASVGASGGTSFEPPLEDAIQQMEQSAYRKADLIFVTDGYADLTPQFLERYDRVKEEKEFRTYSILIGSYVGGWGNPRVLERISDEVFAVTDMAAGQSALDSVFSV